MTNKKAGITGNTKPAFDKKKAREAIQKGRRAKWWLRKGSMKAGFSYLDGAGKKISGAEKLERINSTRPASTLARSRMSLIN